MTTFSQVYDIKNLRRAYKWVLSNPDARYKGYFREAYAAYALASEKNLRYLSRQMRYGVYQASHASKVYVPKNNGILRPISLLTVNDQIAYQACLNVVAESHAPKVVKRINSTTYYHTYAGKTSRFFYKRWEDSYRKYSNSIRRNFSAGLIYVATFDLASFYDSIDHHVLKVFLGRSGVDPDTITFLLGCLKAWTESTWSAGAGRLIYHEHGIPQGPPASGMLSEIVLQHLEQIPISLHRIQRP